MIGDIEDLVMTNSAAAAVKEGVVCILKLYTLSSAPSAAPRERGQAMKRPGARGWRED